MDIHKEFALSFDNAVKEYAITGGVPKYLELFDNTADFIQQIKDIILSNRLMVGCIGKTIKY